MVYTLYECLKKKVLFTSSDLTIPARDSRGNLIDFPVGDNVQNGNTLVIGTTRTGKSCFIKNVVQVLREAYPDDLFVLMDVKQDYLQDKNLYRDGDYVVSQGNIGSSGYNYFQWSMIEEALLSGEPYEELKEMVLLLFDHLPEQGQNQIFVEGAKLIFAAYLNVFIYVLVKSGKRFQMGDIPSNYDIISKYNTMSFEQKRNWIKTMPSQKALCDELLPADKQGNPTKYAESVMSIVRVVIELFKGNFCGKGINSIRNFLASKGNAMFLEFDYNKQRSSSAFFQLFLKKMIQLKMAINSLYREKKLYLILDESMVINSDFDLVNAINVGAGCGLRVILACQSVDHLYMQVKRELNEHYGSASVAGFANVICFRPNDGNTIKAIQEKFGKADIEKMVMPIDRYQAAQVTVATDYIVGSEQLNSLGIGDAYVKIKDSKPVRVHFEEGCV